MPKSNRPPTYRLHRARGCAVVTLNGKNYYLGRFGSPESHEKYARLIAEWNPRLIAEWNRSQASAAPAIPNEPQSDDGLSMNELVLAYLEHASPYYCKNGEPTGELDNIRCAVRPLVQLYG